MQLRHLIPNDSARLPPTRPYHYQSDRTLFTREVISGITRKVISGKSLCCQFPCLPLANVYPLPIRSSCSHAVLLPSSESNRTREYSKDRTYYPRSYPSLSLGCLNHSLCCWQACEWTRFALHGVRGRNERATRLV